MKKLLVAGRIQKYIVAGEQKAIVDVVMPDKDQRSQEEAQSRFNGMIRDFATILRKEAKT